MPPPGLRANSAASFMGDDEGNMSEGRSLDDILDGNEPQVEAIDEVAETPTQETAEQQPEPEQALEGPLRDEKGRFAPKGENSAPPAQQEEAGIPIAALKDERAKRQALEAELAQLRAQLQQPPQPAPDMWEDTQGWQQHLTQQVTNTATEQAALNARLDTSEMLVAQAYPDFEEVRPKILEFMGANPGLREQILGDRHPWNRAYQLVKNHEKMQALAAVDVTDLKAKLREEVKAELLKEAEEKLPPSAPPSISDVRSVGSRSAAPWGGPTPIGDILS